MTNEISMLQDERRQHDRFHRRSTIYYRRFEDIAKDTKAQRGNLCDFSGGGARFLATQAIDKGTQIILELEFAGWVEDGEEWTQTKDPGDIGSLKAIGAVMWCSEDLSQPGKYEIGVRFTGRVR